MNLFESIILGLVQGLTEFLPVSSSGHLSLFSNFLGQADEDLLFELLLHLGTLLAVFIVFWKKILDITLGLFKGEKEAIHYTLMVVLASIPTAAIGFTFEKKVAFLSTQPLVVCSLLFLMGIALYSTKKAPAVNHDNPITWGQALIIGTLQGVAILPGISRSGSTITTALWLKVDRKAAGEFSFLMSIPVIGGACLLKIKDAVEAGIIGDSLQIIPISGVAVSFVSGLISLVYLMKFIQKGKLYQFAYYLWPVSILGFIYFVFQ
tara:strand:+ start:268 stop:1059 length:792 start_codon:yes stop_codon:yes gene_type:complete